MKRTSVLVPVLFLSLLASGQAMAAAAGMPWEGPLDQLLNSLTGPVARIIGAAAMVLTGLAVAFGEGGGLMKKALWVVLGLSIAFNAVSWGLPFLGYAGGLLV